MNQIGKFLFLLGVLMYLTAKKTDGSPSNEEINYMQPYADGMCHSGRILCMDGLCYQIHKGCLHVDVPCPSNMTSPFKCSDYRACFEADKRCDDVKDCADGSDERKCRCYRNLCIGSLGLWNFFILLLCTVFVIFLLFVIMLTVHKRCRLFLQQKGCLAISSDEIQRRRLRLLQYQPTKFQSLFQNGKAPNTVPQLWEANPDHMFVTELAESDKTKGKEPIPSVQPILHSSFVMDVNSNGASENSTAL